MDLDQKINRNLNIAKLFIQNKDYASAKQYINDLLQIKPDSSKAYKLLSQINEALGENDLALNNYCKSLELNKMNDFSEHNSSLVSSSPLLNDRTKQLLKMKSPKSMDVSTAVTAEIPKIDTNTTKMMIENLFEQKFSQIENVLNEKFKNLIQTIVNNNSQLMNSFKKELDDLKAHSVTTNKSLELIRNDCVKLLKSSAQPHPNKNMMESIDRNHEEFSSKLNNITDELQKLHLKMDDMNLFRQDLDENTDDGEYDQNYGDEYYGNDDDNHYEQQQQQIPLNELFSKTKQQSNEWICETCQVPNDDKDTKCVACESSRYPNQEISKTTSNSLFTDGSAAAQKQNIPMKFDFPVFSNENTTNIIPKQTTQPQQQSHQNTGNFFGFKPATVTPVTLPTPPQATSSIFSATITATTNSPFSFNSTNFQSFGQCSTSTVATNAENKSIFSFSANKSPQQPVSNTFSFNSTLNNLQQSLDKSPEKDAKQADNYKDNSASPFQFGQSSAFTMPSQTSTKATNSGLFSFSNSMNFGASNSVNNVSNWLTQASSSTPNNKEKINEQEQQDKSFDSVNNDELILPKVSLPENYKHITGEENETEIYCLKRAKLYVFAQTEYKERGTGELKILRDKSTNKMRIVMRRDQVHTVCLNTSISKDVKFTEKSKHLLIQCIDFSDNDKPEAQTFLLKSKEIPEFFKFIKEQLSIEDGTNEGKQIFSDTNAKNDADTVISKQQQSQTKSAAKSAILDVLDDEIQIVFVREPKPERLPMIEKLKLPKNFYAFEDDDFKPCNGCIGCRVDELDWTDLTVSVLDSDKRQQKDEQSLQPQQSPQKISLFNTDWSAMNGGTGNIFKDLSSSSSLFNYAGNSLQPVKIDTIKLNKENSNDDSNEQQQNFVSEKSKMLPEKYVHKTGEENEDVIYKERAKLYRYVNDTNEFKERGVGEMKILKKRDQDDYRLLMRRDNVYKIICNQKISPILKFNVRTTNSLQWACKDFSENPDGDDQIFVIKFKDENKRTAFQTAVENCMPK